MKYHKRIAKPEWFVTAEDQMHSIAALVSMGRIPASIEYRMATGPILWMLRGIHGTRSNTWALLLTLWHYWRIQWSQRWWEITHPAEVRKIEREITADDA